MARLAVDPAFVVGDLDRRVFGSFVEHMGRCVYTGIYEPDHPTADEDGFRTDVLDLVRELGVTAVRYPGGNFVSNYAWEDGVGPKDQRPRRLDLAWRAIETNQFGTDEFAAWARKAEVEPMWAVNLGTRGITEAIELLQYCNRPAGTELADRRVANGTRSRTTSSCGVSATRWTGPGRSATRPPRSTPGWPRRPPARCAGSTPASSWSPAARATGDADLRRLGAHGAGAHLRPGRPHLAARVLRAEGRRPRPFLAAAEDMDRFIRSVVATADHVGAEAQRQADHALVRRVERLVPAPLPRRARPEDPRGQPADRGRVRRRRRGRGRQPADHAAPARRPGEDREPGPAGERDRPDPHRAGRRAWRQTIFHPFALTSKYAGNRVLRTEVAGPEVETEAYGNVPALWSTATYDESTGEVVLFVVNRSETDEIDCEVPLRHGASGCTGRAPRPVRRRPRRGERTAEDPDRVVPRRIDGTRITDGTCTATLPPVSWHLVRLSPGGNS